MRRIAGRRFKRYHKWIIESFLQKEIMDIDDIKESLIRHFREEYRDEIEETFSDTEGR